MMPTRSVSFDDLLGLVAGTLSHEDFLRVAKAVKNDAALQSELEGFEQIRNQLIQAMVFDKRQDTVEIFAENLAKRTNHYSATQAQPLNSISWLSWLRSFFATSPMPSRFTYGLVAIQTVGIVWLASGALQSKDESAGGMRSAGPDAKQLGVAPANVTFNITFDPATPESTIRGLLLELEAEIIAGPSRLGQYKVVVARNRSQLSLLKFREAAFVEQVIEMPAEAEKPDAKDGVKK